MNLKNLLGNGIRSTQAKQSLIYFFNTLILDKKIEIKEKNRQHHIINLDNTKNYYSSGPIDFDIKSKSVLWFSPDVKQSVLHIFNTNRLSSDNDEIKPIIYQFKFKLTNIRVLQSDKPNNNILMILSDMFEFPIWRGENKYLPIDMAKDITNILFPSEEIDIEIMLKNEDNKYILSIIDAYNTLEGSHKIDGYKNETDQDEVALINFNNFELSKVNKFKYVGLKFTNDLDNIDVIFPINQIKWKKLFDRRIVIYSGYKTKTGSFYTDNIKMFCDTNLHSIYLKNISTHKLYKINCIYNN